MRHHAAQNSVPHKDGNDKAKPKRTFFHSSPTGATAAHARSILDHRQRMPEASSQMKAPRPSSQRGGQHGPQLALS